MMMIVGHCRTAPPPRKEQAAGARGAPRAKDGVSDSALRRACAWAAFFDGPGPWRQKKLRKAEPSPRDTEEGQQGDP